MAEVRHRGTGAQRKQIKEFLWLCAGGVSMLDIQSHFSKVPAFR
jgi:hypothetical protein